MTRWTAAILGLLADGFQVRNKVPESQGWFGRLKDRILRRFLFQSKRESEKSQKRSAVSLTREVVTNVYAHFMSHNIMSVAGASAFFIVLAIFPSLAGLVALYGLLGDPADISTFVATMPEIIPPDVVRLIQSFLNQLIVRSYTNLGTFIIASVIALWSANSAMKSLVESLNIVYERPEKRSILQLNILATVMTGSFVAFLILAVNVMILPVWDWLFQFYRGELLRLRWLILLFAVQVLIATLYYFAPCGRQKKWHFLTAGASLASVAWVVMSMLFTLYLTNFANYSVTYGSLGAAAIFMTWLWLTVMILLTGAEVDAAIGELAAKEE